MNSLVDGDCEDVERSLDRASVCRFQPQPRPTTSATSTSSAGSFAVVRRRSTVNALTDGDPADALSSLAARQQRQPQTQPTQPLSASAARRRRRKRRPRSNSALLAALPPGQRDMFRSLWRATLQAFIQTRQTQGLHTEMLDLNSSLAMEEISRQHLDLMDEINDSESVRDPIIRRVVKERDHSAKNVLVESGLIELSDKRDCLTRHDESIDHHRDRSPSAKKRRSHSGSVEEVRRREKKCKKRSRRSRSYSTGSSSSESEPENSEHSSDHGARKKPRRSKKRKKDKHKGKKKFRRDSSPSGDERRKRHHHHHHQKDKDKDRGEKEEKDRDGKQQQHKSHSNGGAGRSSRKQDESRKSRTEDTYHSERNVDSKNLPGVSKLSFSPLCDEEPAEEEAVEARTSDKNHVELSLKLPSKRVTPSRWFNDEEPPRSLLHPIGAISNRSTKDKPLNGNDASKQAPGPQPVTPTGKASSPRYASEKSANHHSDSSDAEERLLNSHLPKSLRLQSTAKKGPTADAVGKKEPEPSALASKNCFFSPHQAMPPTRQSSSSPDCAKIRKLLASKKVTSPDAPSSVSGTSNGNTNARDGSRSPSEPLSPSRCRSSSRSRTNPACVAGVSNAAPANPSRRPELSKWEKSDTLPAAYRGRSNSRSKSESVRTPSRSRSRERSAGRSHSRSRSRSESARSRRSRSGSERRSTSKRSGSRGRSRSRSYSRSSYTSRSRSRSRRYSSRSRSRSYSRSRSRSRSPSIPRRAGSPSFLDKRRITSARKRPVPYNFYRARSYSSDSNDDHHRR